MVAHPAAAAASFRASVCPLDLEGLMRRANTPRHCTQPSPRSSSLTSLPSLRLPPSLTFTAKIHLASSSWSLARSRARPQLARLTPLASFARDRALFFRCPSESPKEGKSHVWTRGKEGIDGAGRQSARSRQSPLRHVLY